MSRVARARGLAAFAVATVAACLAVFGLQAAEIPKAEGLVNDFASVLSSETKEHVKETGKAVYKAHAIPVVVTTVSSLGGADIDDYANTMARSWKIEKDGKGVLILLAVEEREIKIEVAEGSEGDLNDAKAGRIIRKFSDLLKADDYDQGLRGIYDAVVLELCGTGSLDLEEETSAEGLVANAPWWVKGLGLLIVLVFCIKFRVNPFFILQLMGAKSGGSSSSEFGSGGSFGGGSRFGGGGAKGKF